MECMVDSESWACADCGTLYSQDYTDETRCWRCVRRLPRKARNAEVASGKLAPFYVVALATTRHFGGREEGGWWYDNTHILDVRKVFDWQQALKHVRELREEHPTCPRGRFSVIGGADVTIRLFRTLEQVSAAENLERPRYE